MSAFRSGLFAILMAAPFALRAQDLPKPAPPRPVELTCLHHLGPLPTGVTTYTARTNGKVDRALGADPKAPPIIRADQRAATCVVTELLDHLRKQGHRSVHFAATLPDGTEGGLVLALPGDDAPRTQRRASDERGAAAAAPAGGRPSAAALRSALPCPGLRTPRPADDNRDGAQGPVQTAIPTTAYQCPTTPSAASDMTAPRGLPAFWSSTTAWL